MRAQNFKKNYFVADNFLSKMQSGKISKVE